MSASNTSAVSWGASLIKATGTGWVASTSLTTWAGLRPSSTASSEIRLGLSRFATSITSSPLPTEPTT